MDPAEKGTRNVLLAAAKHKDVCKQVVLTSSFAGSFRTCCQVLPALARLQLLSVGVACSYAPHKGRAAQWEDLQ